MFDPLHKILYIIFKYIRFLLAEQKRSASRVGFAPLQDQAVTCVPVDLSEETFTKISDVQKYPLASSQLAVVITSYDKTIGK